MAAIAYDFYKNSPGIVNITDASGAFVSDVLPNEEAGSGLPLVLQEGYKVSFGKLFPETSTLKGVPSTDTILSEGEGVGTNGQTILNQAVFGFPAGTQINTAYGLELTGADGKVYNLVVISEGFNNDDGPTGGYDDADMFIFIGDNLPVRGETLEITAIEGIVTTPYADINTDGGTCFARGTMIKAENGEVAIEMLKTGDKVWTEDNGFQAIRWIGSEVVDQAKLARNPKLYPIRIAAGALGENAPAQDLYVSPQHRILVNSSVAVRMFGAQEVLVAAKELLALDGVEQLTDFDEVEYFHFLFDGHEIVNANGARAESLIVGAEVTKAVSAESLAEIKAIFGNVDIDQLLAQPARPLTLGREARKLVERHMKNGVAFQ